MRCWIGEVIIGSGYRFLFKIYRWTLLRLDMQLSKWLYSNNTCPCVHMSEWMGGQWTAKPITLHSLSNHTSLYLASLWIMLTISHLVSFTSRRGCCMSHPRVIICVSTAHVRINSDHISSQINYLISWKTGQIIGTVFYYYHKHRLPVMFILL